ncbi:hypothetical protein SAMD00079811_63070 [Scytonema sp. HK-05]|uniref:hypothetical protein n=1 Tax=Scytonema sp. HK-05 TaxID=1137095 RepID=UPI000936AE7B|nr:hypothetical protein [Scytonema sp. HK-05]OKH57306.1 hypothetical protein NIES2130_20955 [Scytonema sp. HK-05]BAY48681.1 hypothetical protein SAMD00079811_63070 [Scytonema sp. HK-05]
MQGFANTASVAVEVGEPGRLDGAAGSSYIKIPVSVTAITTNGTCNILRKVANKIGLALDKITISCCQFLDRIYL